MTKRLRKDVVSLRAGQNANRVLDVDLFEITPVSEETGRGSRMDFSPESSIHGDNYLVGHHVLGHGRRSSDLSHGAMEGLVEIGTPLFFRATSL